MNWLRLDENGKGERGQILAIFAVALVVLLAFVGLAIDFGLAYVAKTTLAKAVDAAALTAMKNVSLGTDNANCSSSAAAQAARQTFNINYLSVPNLGTTPTPCVTFSLDANKNTLVNVTATASINTYFIRVLGSQYNALSVSATATAQRNPLVMSLVLDVSTSMTRNGGEQALGPAVQNFVQDFDPNNNDNVDYVSMVTFGSSAVVNVDNAKPFKSSIDSAVSGINWNVTNYTNSQAGLALGQQEILKIPKTPNLLRVLVFFTDGWPNIQGPDLLTCPAHGSTGASQARLLYCGCDPGDISLSLCGSNNMVFFDPNKCSSADNSCNAPANGCGSFSTPAWNPQTFQDQQVGGGNKELTDVTWCGGTAPSQTPPSDAMYRATLVANAPANNPNTGQPGLLYQNTYIYAIGMGTAITNQPAAQEFLREVANDKNASTFDSSLPVGEAVFTNSTDLNQVFQTIAAKILLRLSK